MNPHQKNKIDVKSLSPDEQRLFRLYGKLPSKSDHFAKHLKDRKYFDSGDYAMSKAGKGDSVDTGSVGTQHPTPENHLGLPGGGMGTGANLTGHPGNSSSPIKESSFLNRETSADDAEEKENAAAAVTAVDPASTEDGAEPQGIPIRR
ncbi:camp-regulated phosphoprotein/endosulfine conserved region-domain-containing protein [Apiospora saccharicola]|uniref:mRNA stability protein n=1 Tax=Apiospora saccharicola TaxID=335842 RepID=A0ABR1U496_9PEZI